LRRREKKSQKAFQKSNDTHAISPRTLIPAILAGMAMWRALVSTVSTVSTGIAMRARGAPFSIAAASHPRGMRLRQVRCVRPAGGRRCSVKTAVALTCGRRWRRHAGRCSSAGNGGRRGRGRWGRACSHSRRWRRCAARRRRRPASALWRRRRSAAAWRGRRRRLAKLGHEHEVLAVHLARVCGVDGCRRGLLRPRVVTPAGLVGMVGSGRGEEVRRKLKRAR